MSNQKCKQCPSGTYAIGDGKRFNAGTLSSLGVDGGLPEGFETLGYDASNSVMGGGVPTKPVPGDACADATWKLKSDYLESNGSSCRSVLTYQVNLDRWVEFIIKDTDVV